MDFGSVPVEAAEGAVLAHSVALPGGKLKKGTLLGADEVTRLSEAGVARVTVARLGPEDMGEDAAALALAEALVAGQAGLRLSKPFTGRVNILAEGPGLARLDAARLHAVNAVDEMLTLATVPDWHRMDKGGMVGTVKVISYGVARSAVEAAVEAGRGAVGLWPVQTKTADLIVTEHDAGSTEDTGRGYRAIEARLAALGMTLGAVSHVAHETGAVAGALAASVADMVLILTASATSDPRDVGPEGLREAGGTVTRFGMPVDPGNLLFYGAARDGRPVIGLPGCARSPAMNGADWVLERLAVGAAPTAEEISAMGVGGLLKEIPTRKQPRGG
ncbi:molybdopterin-binding protein [Maritimibacter sp. DP1N21-5]|uniref:molybdopterin-binding protein n=1 Tax=Maritimibacter sp. DP1N21-5 TaxID=2836867 RepID=UPI001C4457D3|nr:molybdopterin-binding protein [Maritimibacter sp. DP1N21-5]MBV7410100.1 molybdopterin-binding protein [Maritimibacter sp. DP1N21-5]